jgi:hypothetical protein
VWQLSALAQAALEQSHAITVRGTVTTASGGTATNLPISAGSVTIDATSQVRSTATISIADPTWWPADPLDLLSPLGSEILIEYGIVLPGVGTEWCPLGQFVISEADRTRPVSSGDGAITVSLVDRSYLVAEDRFDAPTQVGGGSTTAVAAITSLITDALPTVTVTDLTGSTQAAPSLDIQRERWADGIEALATAIGAECFADRRGNFVIRPQPTLGDTARWTIRSGRTGVIVQKQERQTRELVYNRVVASGQSSSGAPPVWAAVSDTDPNSPTVYGGPFGKKPRFYTSPLLTTADQCTAAATALLARVQGMQGQVSLSTLVHPGLDAGDVIYDLDPAGAAVAHIVDKVVIPLGPADPQQITTRSLDLPPES